MKAKFKNPDQQYIYQLYMTGAAGPNVRSSLQTAFKRGLSGFNFDVEHERASLTYAAWSAGYDIRKSRLPGGSMGVWCVDTDQHGVIQGWIEMFKTDDGRLVTIPDSGRYITVRDPQ